MMELWLFSAQVNQQLDDAMEPNWEKYAAMFGDQQFEVYENKRVDQALVVAGQDERGVHVLNRTLARSRVDMEEIITNVRDRRFEFEVCCNGAYYDADARKANGRRELE